MTSAPARPRSVAPSLLPAMALWGWQTDLLPWALVLGLSLEAARFFRLRFEIPQSDFNRLWNFTALLFLGVGLYLFLAREGLNTVGSLVNSSSAAGRLEGLREISLTVLNFMRWLPFVFFPFLLAHAWSRATTLPWSTFSLYEQVRSARSPGVPPPEWAVRHVHPGHPYVAIVLFASTAATAHPVAYLPLLLAVVTWSLWPWRNPRFGWLRRAGLWLLLMGAALLTQGGLNQLREALQSLEGRLLQSSGAGNFDQLRSVTGLGAVGKLKQSGRIVLRIRTSDGRSPGLLREGAFNRYRAQTWSSAHRDFEPVGTAGDGSFWRVVPGRRSSQTLTLSRYTSQGDAPLAVPGDVLTVRDLPLVTIETNYLAATRLHDGPPLVTYSVEHGPGGGFDGAPEPDDTDLEHLGTPDREVIREVAQQLGLVGQTPATAIERVRRFFTTHFEYSLWSGLRPVPANTSPLAVFLRDTRAGHCEYFATATVLLLRAAEIPTRYAVGYSPEDRRGEDWLARGRDAHAWCLAYVNGSWQNVDTTPEIWRERESARAGWWEGLSDLFSQTWFRFAVWRQQGGNWQLAVFAAGMVVLSWLAWRQLRGSRWRRSRKGPSSRETRISPPGLDSEFYAVTRVLERQHGARPPAETLTTWIRRLGLGTTSLADPLGQALALHNRLRFDPNGLPGRDREQLRSLAQDLARRVR